MEAWEFGFRAGVKASSPKGWAVTPHKGKVRLQVRELDRQPINQSALLPYRWLPEESADCLLRIRAIVRLYAQAGGSLTKAAELAEGRSSKGVLPWADAIENFRLQRVTNLGITSATTWRKKYQPVLESALLALVQPQPPKDGPGLLELALARWKSGTRSRQIASQSLRNFLVFVVAKQDFPPVWAPPAIIEKEARNPKRDGWPLSDQQILQLLQGLPQNPPADRWRFAIQLLAVYGLRPEELRYLALESGQLVCNYCKAAGPGRRTKPRRLYPLLVRDHAGAPVDWHLVQRLASGEDLPPLGRLGSGGESVRTYLKRQKEWQLLEADALAAGGELVPYCFRHRYAKASHGAGLPVAQIAAAMGHSIQVHLTAYAKFQPDGLEAAYAQANLGGGPAA